MTQKSEKTRNGGKWTEARFRSFVTSTLRSGTRRWPPKYDALKAAFTERKVNKKSGRQANHYLCAACEETYPSTQVQVDHKEPIGPNLGWDLFIEALFCEADNLQVLCKPCHKKKTKKETSLRFQKQSKQKKGPSSSKES
jgi:5-methylcytosine-specific restriction endonuclease McrA